MKKINKLIAGILATAIASGGLVIEDTYNKDISLMDKMYSGAEYRVIREEIGNRGSADNLDWEGLQLYVEILNREKDKCGGKIYPIENKQDIRNLLKRFDSEGCPE